MEKPERKTKHKKSIESKTSNKDNENNNINLKEEEENTNNQVFISGIPYETTEEEIKELFEKFGKIDQIKVPKYQDSGKNRGYAHIIFKNTSSANSAVAKNKQVYIQNRYLIIEYSKGEQAYERKVDLQEIPEDCRTIIIKNLPYELSEDELAQKFKPCGSINSIRMVYHPKLNHFKGFAYIDFDSQEAVKIALHLNGKELKNRKMIVDFEDTKPKQGFKFRSKEPSKFNQEYRSILNKKKNKH